MGTAFSHSFHFSFLSPLCFIPSQSQPFTSVPPVPFHRLIQSRGSGERYILVYFRTRKIHHQQHFQVTPLAVNYEEMSMYDTRTFCWHTRSQMSISVPPLMFPIAPSPLASRWEIKEERRGVHQCLIAVRCRILQDWTSSTGNHRNEKRKEEREERREVAAGRRRYRTTTTVSTENPGMENAGPTWPSVETFLYTLHL